MYRRQGSGCQPADGSRLVVTRHENISTGVELRVCVGGFLSRSDCHYGASTELQDFSNYSEYNAQRTRGAGPGNQSQVGANPDYPTSKQAAPLLLFPFLTRQSSKTLPSAASNQVKCLTSGTGRAAPAEGSGDGGGGGGGDLSRRFVDEKSDLNLKV